ncbi:MAG: DUF4433 domain-containing protein [Candidatus Kapaibacterium sp.]
MGWLYLIVGFIIWSLLVWTLSHFEIGPFKTERLPIKRIQPTVVGYINDKFENKIIIIHNEKMQFSYFVSKNDDENDVLKLKLELPWSNLDEFAAIISEIEVVEEELLRRKEIIKGAPFNNLYHITHINNISSILENGLLSDNHLQRDNINFENIADLEVKGHREKTESIYNKSILEYVPLYFTPKTPMLYKKQDISNNLVVIVIHPFVLFEKDLIFTDGNASSKKTKFYSDLNDLKCLDWECIRSQFWTKFEDGKRKRCSEVLVHDRIDVNYFNKIVCNNKKLYDELSINYSESNIKIELDNKYFF